MKKEIFYIVIIGLVLIFGAVYYFLPEEEPKITEYSSGELKFPELSFSPPEYDYSEEKFQNPEYSLPLSEFPENYQRDISERFGKNLSENQKNILLSNGVIIIPGNKYQRFSQAFSELSGENIPIFITSDSIVHLFHIEFNEILKNLEIKKLSGMLNSFLDATIEKSKEKYNSLKDEELKELVRRNIAYLSIAKKLLEPDYKVENFVKSDVGKEIERIEEHQGFFKSEIFSKDCPKQCLDLAFPEEKCSQEVKGGKIFYQDKEWDSMEFYKEICTRVCYCEDYSQYVPRGHYTASEELERYFKAMMWLGRLSFKARGENWTKQAILLTDVVKSAKVDFEGEKISAYQIWNKIYTITGFFAGASDDLTFYDYDFAISKVFGYGFDEEEKLKEELVEKIKEEISELRSPEILGGFEIDLAGNLKDLTQGMRLIGQRYALDSQILGDLVYKNVGPNINSPYYDDVIDFCSTYSCTKPKEFYYSCQNMEEEREKYWNEVCDAALMLYEDTPSKLYSVCRFMPSGLDVMDTLGSGKAEEILEKYYQCEYCNYNIKQEELKNLVNSYTQEKWTQNLYNTWLWMLQPILKEKPEGYPNWMRSEIWKLKDLITGLASWAELRHDTILYVKQSYTWAVAKVTSMPPIEAKYYGYVEPNPELFARAKFAVDYLSQGLKEQGVMTEEVSNALEKSSELMEKLKVISEKELRVEILEEEDYNYIKNIDSEFDLIIEDLASALTIKEKKPLMKPGVIEETSLEGKDEAFKTSLIADVHTESNTKKVLEVGSGKTDWILVAHKSKDGRIGIAVGPMFSYYEFAWPMKDRLTDEKWRDEVMTDMERPIWYKESEIKGANSSYIIE